MAAKEPEQHENGAFVQPSQDIEWPLAGYKPEGTRVFLELDTEERLIGVKVEQVLPPASSGELLNLSRLLDQLFENKPPEPVGFQVTLKQEVQLIGEGTFVGVRLDPLRKGRVSCLKIEHRVPIVGAQQKLVLLSLPTNVTRELGYDTVEQGGLIGRNYGTLIKVNFDSFSI
jgi:hypothetical protein